MDIKLGMIKGRHDLPVDEHLIDKVDNVLDFETMRGAVDERLTDLLEPYVINGCRHSLTLYVTGLSAVLAEVVRWCARSGAGLTLMHYDFASDSYLPQVMF